MVKFNKNSLNIFPLQIHIFLQLLFALWTIISDLAQLEHILFFRKIEGSNTL